MKEPIVSELLEEVRQQRAEKALLAAFDRELDETRRDVLRPRPGQARLDRAIWAAEVASTVSAEPGLDDVRRPGERLAKRVIEKLVGWYVAQVASGVTSFANASVRALGQLSDNLDAHAERVDALSDRIDALVEELEASRPPSLASVVPLASARHLLRPSPLERHAILAEQALERLRSACGRVLHADSRSGGFVAKLIGAGIDAYGTEPSAALVEDPVTPGLDLRQADALGHLRDIAAHGLGGAVLSGCVDRLSLGDACRLAFLLGTRIAPSGAVALLGTQPAVWRHEATPLERDLAPGRPLHPETWCYLLAEYGFTRLETSDGQDLDGFLVTGVHAR